MDRPKDTAFIIGLIQLEWDATLNRWIDKNAPAEEENKPPPPPQIPTSMPGDNYYNLYWLMPGM